MEEEVYFLDNAASPLCPSQLADRVCSLLKASAYGNPHSRNPTSRLTTDAIEQSRYRVMNFFNTSRADYSVIFTSGATAALKLLAESFCFGCDGRTVRQSRRTCMTTDFGDVEAPWFAYLKDNHTSAVGMRELVKDRASVYCATAEIVDEGRAVTHHSQNSTNLCSHCNASCHRNLFVYPAQSNFCGRKYPAEWTCSVQSGAFGSSTFVCLDAASFVSTSKLDLSVVQPDFVAISFYKIFGYPTGLGALLVSKRGAAALKKRYFGGGSVFGYLPGNNFRKDRDVLSDRFEDGTVDYLSIVSLKCCFEQLNDFGGMTRISDRVHSLSDFAVRGLTTLRHHSGASVAKIYCHNDGDFSNVALQGPIINFNLMRPDGSFVGFNEVEKMAELYGIHLRTGCFCNQGACQTYLALTDDEIAANFEKGKVCGDSMDLMDGRPLGSVRVSFGAASSLRDAAALLAMVYDCFVVRSARSLADLIDQLAVPDCLAAERDAARAVCTAPRAPTVATTATGVRRESGQPARLTDILLYPVKSGGALRVSSWRVSSTGLAFDRRWMVCSELGVCLTQKRCKRLCAIKPWINLRTNTLHLSADHVKASIQLPLVPMELQPRNEYSVCADRVGTSDCGDESAGWLRQAIGVEDARLGRQLDSEARGVGADDAALSLANVAQYLLLSRESVRTLLGAVQSVLPALTEDELIGRFRPNLVIDGGAAFAEEVWTTLTIGRVRFKVVGKCRRCQMICINQQTGEKTPQILTALRDLRRGEMCFGVYLQADLTGLSDDFDANIECGFLVRPST